MLREIEEKGIYDLTFKELSFGCRTAWRNAPRCINRIQWRNLTVFDQRDVKTAEEMCAAMINHIRYCTNPTKPGVLRLTYIFKLLMFNYIIIPRCMYTSTQDHL